MTDAPLQRIRFTRHAIYWYKKTGTWSLRWRCRWRWTVAYVNDDMQVSFHWGCILVEKLKFDEDDPWGKTRAETLAAMFQMLEAHLRQPSPRLIHENVPCQYTDADIGTKCGRAAVVLLWPFGEGDTEGTALCGACYERLLLPGDPTIEQLQAAEAAGGKQ